MSELEDFDFDARLKRELRRVDAPQGFADRTMSRVGSQIEDQIKEQRRGRLLVMPGRAVWMTVAAMLLAGIAIGTWQQREKEFRERRLEEREAAMYRQQLDVAMQVTGRTLVVVQQRIERAGEIHATGRKREVE